MHQLEGDAAHQIIVGGRSLPAGCRRHGQQGSQALATSVNEMGRHRVEVGVTKDDRVGEEHLEPN